MHTVAYFYVVYEAGRQLPLDAKLKGAPRVHGGKSPKINGELCNLKCHIHEHTETKH